MIVRVLIGSHNLILNAAVDIVTKGVLEEKRCTLSFVNYFLLWLSTLADTLSPLSMVANPRKAPTRLYTTYEKIQLETVTHLGINEPNVA